MQIGLDFQHHGRGGLDQSAKPVLLSVERAADLDPEVEPAADLIAPLAMAGDAVKQIPVHPVLAAMLAVEA